MNFREIVQKVNLHAGIQGRVLTVDGLDFQEYLAESVRAAFIDIQNDREDFKFMRRDIEFDTIPGTSLYTNEFLMTYRSLDLGIKRWIPGTFFKNGSEMTEMSYDEYREKEDNFNSTDSSFYVIKDTGSDPGVIISCPDTSATIKGSYYVKPQVLSKNTSIPILPDEYHYYIVWRALEDVAAYLGNTSIYERHSYKADILRNRMMRSQVPSRRARPRKPFYRRTR